MSTSLLYHAFGIRIPPPGHPATRYEAGEVVVRVESPRESLRCAACNARHREV